MGAIIKFRPKGYNGLTKDNKAAVMGKITALLSFYNFEDVYSVLNQQDKVFIDARIEDLLQEQRQEARSGCRL